MKLYQSPPWNAPCWKVPPLSQETLSSLSCAVAAVSCLSEGSHPPRVFPPPNLPAWGLLCAVTLWCSLAPFPCRAVTLTLLHSEAPLEMWRQTCTLPTETHQQLRRPTQYRSYIQLNKEEWTLVQKMREPRSQHQWSGKGLSPSQNEHMRNSPGPQWNTTKKRTIQNPNSEFPRAHLLITNFSINMKEFLEAWEQSWTHTHMSHTRKKNPKKQTDSPGNSGTCL